MPNHVMNVLEFDGRSEDLQKLVSAMDTNREDADYRNFDFNAVLPMPVSLSLPSGGQLDMGIAAYLHDNPDVYGPTDHFRTVATYRQFPWFAERYPGGAEEFVAKSKEELLTSFGDLAEELQGITLYEAGKLAVQNWRKYGFTDWYGWCNKNWGTKWNAYDVMWEDNEQVYFQTAWSAPHPVIQKLSEKFPEVTILHRWADEDFGSNVGKVVYRAGQELTGGYYKNGSKEAKLQALELLYGNELPEHMRRCGDDVVYCSELKTLEQEQYLSVETHPKYLAFPDREYALEEYYTPSELLWLAQSRLQEEFPTVEDLTKHLADPSGICRRQAIEKFFKDRGLVEKV